MPLVKVFSVYDSKIGAYMQPFFARNAGEALRSWEEVCNDGQSMMSKHPADFTLFEIGGFDDSKGTLCPTSPHQTLGTALEFKRPSPSQNTLPFPAAASTPRSS